MPPCQATGRNVTRLVDRGGYCEGLSQHLIHRYMFHREIFSLKNSFRVAAPVARFIFLDVF
jgi:hypothetical protein